MALTNALLVRYALGWTWVVDAASVATYGRREGFLALGAAQSMAEVTRIAEAVLAEQADPQVATTVGIEPTGASDVPYGDYGVADWITVPDEDGTPASMRVRALTVAEDPEGFARFVPELRTIADERERRLDRWLKRMANGTLGGTVESATPIGGATASAPAGFGQSAGGSVTIPPWYQSAAAVGVIPARWYPMTTTPLRRLTAMLSTPGASDTEVQLLRNGVNVTTTTLVVSSGLGVAGVDVDAGTIAVGPETDYLDVEVLAWGAGAFGLTVVAT